MTKPQLQSLIAICAIVFVVVGSVIRNERNHAFERNVEAMHTQTEVRAVKTSYKSNMSEIRPILNEVTSAKSTNERPKVKPEAKWSSAEVTNSPVCGDNFKPDVARTQ